MTFIYVLASFYYAYFKKKILILSTYKKCKTIGFVESKINMKEEKFKIYGKI